MKTFRVAMISTNANSFGLHDVILVAEDGTSIRGLKTEQFLPKKGDEIRLHAPYADCLSVFEYECPEDMTPCPLSFVKEIWK